MVMVAEVVVMVVEEEEEVGKEEKEEEKILFEVICCGHCLVDSQGVSELPDYNKISFSEMPAIPIEEIVPDASPEVHIYVREACILLKGLLPPCPRLWTC